MDRKALEALRATVPGEELWILARAADMPSAEALPGSGELLANIGSRETAMPLKHTEVKATVSGSVCTVSVEQKFANPYPTKIEATYVFPLPHDAAVTEFIMSIGERRIRGIIRDRAEAEQIYAQAKAEGYVASLLTEERPNIFRQVVANIEPGKEIDVQLKYFNTLAYVDGWYEFAFPMVVGPRFNPAGATNGVGAVHRGETGSSGQRTEIEYLAPGEKNGHDIALTLDIDAGVPIQEFACRTHTVTTEQPAPERLQVALTPQDDDANRDFVFRFRVASQQIQSALITQTTDSGRYFQLVLYPPAQLSTLKRQALELVFVLDCSGSMAGRPITQAKTAVLRALRRLQPDDSFQIITFSMSTSQLSSQPLIATPQNVQRGKDFVRTLQGEGGTMMLDGVKAALNFPHDPNRLRFVCFLTDGYIGNEAEILAEIQRRLGESRIFSFGIGSAVNRYLIESMASMGRGVGAFLGSHDEAAQIMDDFFDRISHPCLTNLKVDWNGLSVSEVLPPTLPDLFVGRPVTVTGRFEGAPSLVRVRGDFAGETLVVPAKAENDPLSHEGLAQMWARRKVRWLAEQGLLEGSPDVKEQIRQTALDYNLVSPFTAFVAVDSSRQTEGTPGLTVPAAVPVPEGVKYTNTVSQKP